MSKLTKKEKDLRIKELRALAEERGGMFLSNKYLGVRIPHRWQCEDGHTWKATPDNVRRGQWCPFRVGKMSPMLSYKLFKKLAEGKGGKLLSKKYIKSNRKLKWQCREGHIWKAVAGSVKSGCWCRICAHQISRKKRMSSIEPFKKIAEKRGGKLLSKNFEGVDYKLKWLCNKGHTWEATPAHVKNGTWCPVCLGSQKIGIEPFKKIAEKRGGKLLSTDYISVDTKLEWQCENNHKWRASPYNIRAGTWCPVCSAYITERICAETLKMIFKKEFPKQYPKWLLNDRGNQMELDGYNKDLGIAFEYNGIQHYKEMEHYNVNFSVLNRRKNDDRYKRKLCKERKITLLTIPYTVNRDDIYAFVIKKLKEHSIGIPKHRKVSIGELDLYNRSIINFYKDIAIDRGGELLSNIYIDSKTPLEWRCGKGHNWRAIPSSIRKGAWCRACAGSEKIGIEPLQKKLKKKEENYYLKSILIITPNLNGSAKKDIFGTRRQQIYYEVLGAPYVHTNLARRNIILKT